MGLLGVLFSVSAVAESDIADASQKALTLLPEERLVTILSTNDIHGGVEPSQDPSGKAWGGLALWSGAVKSIRQGIQKRYQAHAGTLVLDAGDQFQGTLISNYDEGQLVFAAMNAVGYDAAIPGNHDFDFGPIGWLVDQSSDPSKRLEALTRVASEASFPLLSANTFLRSSIQDSSARSIEVENANCKPVSLGTIDWSRAKNPAFLKPYKIFSLADVRVAVIGVDNPMTPKSTTADNVSDLCFADPGDTYLRWRNALASQADVFVMIIHDGDVMGQHKMLEFVEKLNPQGAHQIDAVISGHTHMNYNEDANGVPVIQSGSGGKNFGRIDLVWNTTTKSLNASKTRSFAGIRLLGQACDEKAKPFCSVVKGTVKYEGVTMVADPVVNSAIQKARSAVQSLASRRLGRAAKEMDHDRTKESQLSDAICDSLRDMTGADVAFINGSGLRAPIRQGDFTYEDLFRVLPFNNHEMVIGPMTTAQLVELIGRSVKSCGTIDALMQSGLKVTFQRNCNKAPAKESGIDDSAQLLHVETLAGEVLFDANPTVAKAVTANRSFKVATLDFLAAGGSGYATFKTAPLIEDKGIFREALTNGFLKQPANWNGDIDGRWKDLGTP